MNPHVKEGFHLVRRFFGAVRPGAPTEKDEAWVRSLLLPGELALWRRMNNPDRRHAAGVARMVEAELGQDATRPVLAAAVLHDVGKVVSDYRTPARVAATLVWAAAGSDQSSSRARQWAGRGKPWQRLGQYRLHPELGERLLIEAGSDPLTSSWAADHHRPIEDWRAPHDIGAVLKACDDD